MVILYDYVNQSGKNEIKAWSLGLQVRERAKLDAKLEMIEKNSIDDLPEICPHIKNGIYKLKVRGKVQLRPMLCKGPRDMISEATILTGAFEVGSQLQPPDAVEIAIKNREFVQQDPDNRRCVHEQI